MLNQIESLESRRLLFAGQAETIFGVGGDSAVPGFDATDQFIDVAAGFDDFIDNDTGFRNTLLVFDDDRLVRMDIGGRLVDSFGTSGGLDLNLLLGADVQLIDVAYSGGTDRIATLTIEDVSGTDRFALRILDEDGMLDTSFGGSGRLLIDAGIDAQRVTFSPFGDLSFAGIANDGTVVAGEISTIGSGSETISTLDTIVSADFVTVFKQLADGRYYVGGTVEGIGGRQDAFVYRLDPATLPSIAGNFDSFADFSTTGSNVLDIADTLNGPRALIAAVSDEPVDNDFAGDQPFFDTILVAEVFEDFALPTGQFLQDVTDFVYTTRGRLDVSGEATLVGLRDGEAIPFASTRFLPTGTIDLSYGFNGFTEFEGAPRVLPEGRVFHLDNTPANGGDATVGLIEGGPGRVGSTGGVTVGSSVDGATVMGSAGNDAIRVSIRASDGRYVLRSNGEIRSFPAPSALRVQLGDGDDVMLLAAGVGSVFAEGQFGNDTLRGSAFEDLLAGGGGDDFVYGNDGDDIVLGNDDDDFLFGGNDRDSLTGGGGNDSLNGNAQGDTLRGSIGDDTLNGAGGNDILLGDMGFDDNRGGAGFDQAQDDEDDIYSSVEALLT